jgi:antitoxin component of MazEF toxin-antitoxin module
MARSIQLSEGEEVAWRLEDEQHLVLHREQFRSSQAESQKKLQQQDVQMSFWELLEQLFNP